MPTLASSGTPPDTQAHQMRCMEIWGSYSAADQRLQTSGLDVQILAEPHRADEAGGDVHFVSMCGAGRITRFLLADVAGHGGAVAELAGKFRKLLRKHINRIDTSAMARALNDEFAALSRDGRFATALLATYFAPTRQLILVNAGHPRPLWYQADRGQWRPLEADMTEAEHGGPSNLPLGVIEGTGYEQFAVTLGRDDRVLLFTDSLTEAADRSGNMIGEQGLMDLVRGVPMADVDTFSRRLLEAVRDHRGGAAPDDDVTLLALHHTAEDPPVVGLGEKLRVMAKMLGILPA